MRENDDDQSSSMPPSYPPKNPHHQRDSAQSHNAAPQNRAPGDSGIAQGAYVSDESEVYASGPQAAEDAAVEESPAKKAWSFILEFLTVLAVALLAAVIIKTYFVQAFEIPSESMEETLVPGDRIVVNKLADSEEDLNRGDVVVFVDPGGWLDPVPQPERPAIQNFFINVGEAIGLIPQNVGDHLVKRIIGMPGDRVTCCGEDGRISVNGEPVSEPYLKPGVNPSDIPFDVTVPEGYVWVLGDNRANSADSRTHQMQDGFGFLPIQNIEGRAWLRMFPLDRFGTLDSATTSFENVPHPVKDAPAPATNAPSPSSEPSG